jgi:hypothetical protein
MRITFVALFLVATAIALRAQDSTSTRDSASFPKSITWDVSAAHYYQTDASDRDARVPASLPTHQTRSRTVSDNPLYHGATFANLAASIEIIGGIVLEGEVVGEHRGISYGVYAVDEMIVFPRVRLAFDTTFTLFSQPFRAIARVGNFSGDRWGEGLTFYNMDWQGSDLELGWRWLRIWRKHIGDAAYGIGLAIDDATDFGIGVLDLPLADSLFVDAQASMIDYHSYGDEGTTGSIGLRYGSSARAYAQYESRAPLLFASSTGDHSAFLVGIDGELRVGDLSIRGRAEWRHYGASFNAMRSSESARYRTQSSTIGEFLYPLDYLERPFSQWAVFTEYQGLDVEGQTLQLDARYRLPFGFVAVAKLDWNNIAPAGAEEFMYDFYDIGLGWEPIEGSSIIVSRTNRAMNLDLHYPTYYLYRTPVTAMTFRINLH